MVMILMVYYGIALYSRRMVLRECNGDYAGT